MKIIVQLWKQSKILDGLKLLNNPKLIKLIRAKRKQKLKL